MNYSASVESERTILGICCREDEAACELACSSLREEHFELDSHRKIFREIASLHSSRQPVSIVTIAQELHRRGQIESVGGMGYISDLTTGIPMRVGERVRNYIDRVKEFYRLRELRRLGEEMDLQATESDAVASSIVQSAAARLESIMADSGDEDASISASIVASMDRFNQERTLQSSPGLSFGIERLDEETGGMMPGFQTAVGASSGVGKTTFMCQAILAALESGAPVDAFLLEPTRDQVTRRLVSLISGTPYGCVTRPWTCPNRDAEKIMLAAGRLAEMPLRLHDRATMTLDEVIGQARVGISRYGTRLVCLDYIQRLKIRSSERDESVRLKVARASTALADLVKGTQCHSLLLSQINTGRKNGAGGIPTMFDFRESSQIENDAHTILLLHRQYDEDQGHYGNDGAIFVPKQRFGSPCSIKVRFDPVTSAWTDQLNQTYQETWQNRQETR